MTIHYSQRDSTQASRFPASHWVHTEALHGLHLVTLTGIVILDFNGNDHAWRRDRLHLVLNFPTYFIPPDKRLQIEEWAPFVTLNTISNVGPAIHAGWAVDAFGGPGRRFIREVVEIWADLAISDVDGSLVRVGYSLTVSGRIADEPPGPDLI